MAGVVLNVLTNVEDPTVEAGGGDQGGALDLQTAGDPGGGAAGELTDEVVMTDLVALTDQLGAVLVGPDDEQERLVLIDEPAEPGGHGADEQGPAGEDAHHVLVVGEQVGEVLGCVSGGGQGVKRQSTQVDGVVAGDRSVGPSKFGTRRGDHRGAMRGELAAAGDEIGVQMGLDAEHHPGASPFRFGQERAGMAARIDDRQAAVAEVDQPRCVPEPGVDDGSDDRHRPSPRSSAPTATGSRARRHSGNPSSRRRARSLRRASTRTASSA